MIVKPQSTRHNLRMLIILSGLVCCLGVFTLARFIMKKNEAGVLTTQQFYFTSNFLKDTSDKAEYFIDPNKATKMCIRDRCMYQAAAMLKTMPHLNKVWICDPLDEQHASVKAETIAAEMERELHVQLCSGIEFVGVTNLQEAVETSDVIVTITPSRKPLIQREWVRPGTHFSCIGSDTVSYTHLVSDGIIDEQALKDIDKDQDWLVNILANEGVDDYRDVFLCLYQKDGMFVIRKETNSRNELLSN